MCLGYLHLYNLVDFTVAINFYGISFQQCFWTYRGKTTDGIQKIGLTFDVTVMIMMEQDDVCRHKARKFDVFVDVWSRC